MHCRPGLIWHSYKTCLGGGGRHVCWGVQKFNPSRWRRIGIQDNTGRRNAIGSEMGVRTLSFKG